MSMATRYISNLRLLSRDVRLFLVATALIGFSWDGVRTVLLNLYLLRLGYGPEIVGLINGFGAFAFALVSLPAGVLGARLGSRRMILVGVALMAAGIGLLPLVELLPAAWTLPWLLSATMAAYLGLVLYYVNSLPFLMGATGLEERDYAFAAQIALMPLAAFAGSLVGGLLPGLMANVLGSTLQDPAPYRYPVLLAGLMLLPGILALIPASEVAAGEGEASDAGARPAAATVAGDSRPPYALIVMTVIVVGLRFAGRGPLTTFFNVYLDDALGVSTVLIGALIAAGQLVSVPAALLSPLAVARWGNGRMVSWGTMGVAITMLPLALIPQWWAAGAGFVGAIAMFSVSTGPIRVYSQELVTRRWWGAMSGAVMMGSGLGIAVMTLAGGYAVAALGYRTLFLIGAGLVAAGAVIFWAYFRAPRGELARKSVVEPSG
jgi:MFS family permease